MSIMLKQVHVTIGLKFARRWRKALMNAGGAAALIAVGGVLGTSPLSTHSLRAPPNSTAEITYSPLPGAGDLLTLVARPSDRQSSTVVGGMLLQAGLSGLSIRFLRQAVVQDRRNLTLHAALGEALVLANGGKVVPAAKDEFDLILASDPNDLVARFYMAYWLLQNGKPKPALVKWVGLMRTVGADSLWYDKLWVAMPLAADQIGVDRLALQALCTAGM